MEAPGRNLALELVRVTEAAALSSARWLGKGDKNAGDQAAVDAMRLSFDSVDIKGVVVIGEGEKDEAPMLYGGEEVGTGRGPAMDVAVDPVEGTRLLAYGRPNAISVVGVAPAGSMFDPGPSYYMRKLVVPSQARDVVDLDAPVADTLKAVAKALSIPEGHVFGVASFYTMYQKRPVGRYHLQVCTNISCALQGAAKLLEKAYASLRSAIRDR